MTQLPYAEDMNYFQTSQTGAETWISKAIRLIEHIGGTVITEAFGSEPSTGRAAYMLLFEIDGDRFKVMFPVLPCKIKSHERAARIQAATLLYHDVKAKCMIAAIFGNRAAFFQYFLLPGGRTAGEVSTPELVEQMPLLLAGGSR